MTIIEALEQAGMYQGHVLTPELAFDIAVHAATPAAVLGGYGLIGYMSKQMCAQIKASPDDMGFRFTVMETPERQMLLVVTVQAGACQARVLMHLKDREVQAMLQWSAQTGCMQIILGVADTDDVACYQAPFVAADLPELMALAQENRELALLDALNEFAKASAVLLREHGRLRCAGMGSVDDVTVTNILWSDRAPALAAIKGNTSMMN